MISAPTGITVFESAVRPTVIGGRFGKKRQLPCRGGVSPPENRYEGVVEKGHPNGCRATRVFLE